MEHRILGKTGFKISAISIGTWQVGGKWGSEFNEKNAEKIINSAIDNGIDFIDTADVYGGGLSEKAIGKVLKTRKEKVYVASKCGRKLNPHNNESYKPEILKKFVEDSLRNLQIDVLDLIQLHCPPAEVYYRNEIFEMFDKLKMEGKILNLGVSVEKVDEAMKAVEYPNVTTVQIIFNIFRQKPKDQFFKKAKEKNVGIIVRVPLASGLLTGKFDRSTQFSKEDHRFFNRNGDAFDKGETFSGVDYETGLQAVDELKKIFPGKNLAHIALKWILGFDEVSCIIPGASRPDQVLSNIEALKLSDFSKEELIKIEEVYNKYIKKSVENLW
jgi:aryl-alcohol dehydrogenase-like predicted oxidoreductase